MSNFSTISRRNFLSALAINTWIFSRGEIYPVLGRQSRPPTTKEPCPRVDAIDPYKSTETFKPFSFVFVTDCHLSSGTADSYKLTQESQLFLQEAIKQINLLKPDFVIFGGDQVESPGEEDKNWQLFLDIMQMLNCPWHFILGEADVSGAYAVNKMHTYGRDWQSLGLNNSQPYWSYDQLPGVHLIGLDTSAADSVTGFLSNEQLDWLKNDLAQQKAALTLLISHHPLLPPPPFDKGNRATQYLLPQAAQARDILTASGKQILAISGHVHISKIEQQNNVCYISCPSLDVYPCAFRYFQVSPSKIAIQTDQINFPELVKKAKGNLLSSSLASELTGGHPRNFVNLASGKRVDQNNSLALFGSEVQ